MGGGSVSAVPSTVWVVRSGALIDGAYVSRDFALLRADTLNQILAPGATRWEAVEVPVTR